MIKSFQSILVRFAKIIGMVLIGVLVVPVVLIILIFSLPFIAVIILWSWIRKEPKPTVPDFGLDMGLGNQELAQQIVTKLRGLVEDATVEHDEKSFKYILRSARLTDRAVEITYDRWIDINIDGLNCYEWNTATEETDIDFFLWICAAALRNGVYSMRSKLGRLGFWTKSDELKVWLKVQREGTSYDAIECYNNPPDKVMQMFEHSKKSVSG